MQYTWRNVAAYSIRHRILKAVGIVSKRIFSSSCSLFDPTQDTERWPLATIAFTAGVVAAYSIRHRILKGGAPLCCAGCFPRCSLFDPTQDTESY